jgi:ankyrin repeat protein
MMARVWVLVSILMNLMDVNGVHALDTQAAIEKLHTLGIENSEEALFSQARQGQTVNVGLLLDAGIPIDSRMSIGQLQPIHLAARNGYLEMVKLLLARGADPDALAALDATPLTLAIDNAHVAVVRVLLENKATVDLGNTSMGATPLHKAVSHGASVEIVSLLLKHGARVNHSDRAGWTALHHAALSGKMANGEELIKSGAQINATSNAGETPLHVAAFMGNLDFAKMLLRHGANRSTKTPTGKTPYDSAQEKVPNTLTLTPAQEKGKVQLARLLRIGQ